MNSLEGVFSPGSNAIKQLARFAALLVLALFVILPVTNAQTTGTFTGSVYDTSGAVIPNASVTLVNEASNDTRNVLTNGDGKFVFAALIPGSYTFTVELKGFKTAKQTGVVLHAGDNIKIPDFALEVGQANQTVTVAENTQIIPVDNGERAAVLDAHDIDNLALETRNISELLKVLPGVSVTPNMSNNAGVGSALLATSTGQSAVGNNLGFNGVPNRGGTSQLSDGVDVNDPGCNCNAIATINPDMTQEVSVQTSNFGADVSHGPVIINTISKSGGSDYHGTGYIFARNDALNANDWQSNNQGIPKGNASYYYPGGNVGGPVPFTHKKLLFWFGYEHYLQNQGNANVLHSYIPSAGMAGGDFTSAGAGNAALCPGGFSATATNWCNNLQGFGLSNGAVIGVTPGYPVGIIPTAFLDPGAAALASIWPSANADPATTPNNYNYYEPIDNIHDGYTYRARVDYNLSEKTKFYFSYQFGNDSSLVQGNGAHIYWTPDASIPFPGGGLSTASTTKSVAGHFVHIFNSTTTNELIATWGYGNFPVGPSDISADYKSTLGYTYGSIYNGSLIIPAYNSAGSNTFPDFGQQDIFEPTGRYTVRKQLPQFEDDFTKVWGAHTIKLGAFTENVSNLQGSFSNINGNLNFNGGGNPDVLTGVSIGGQNPTANFFTGTATGYSEQNAAPVESLAFQTTSAYIDDSFKATRRLTVEVGLRFEHISHWYDRNGVGNAVWLPGLVASDYASGQANPGIRYHAIDPGIPTSGSPNRLAFVSPRFGMAYDVFGTGKTVVRGGIGAYRFNDQTNDYDAALTTALGVQNYGLPGGKNVLLSEISSLKPQTPAPGQVNGGVNAVPYNDYDVPVTYAYNLTISQQVPWHSLLEVAYVGNESDQLFMGGQTISGSGFGSFTDQNKTPLGAFFLPDPVTGIVAPDPENINTSTGGVNSNTDYHPYAKYYGSNQILVNQHVGYSNYNALQVSWVKRSDRLTFNANFTWSKNLGTGLQIDPFTVHGNYGVLSNDRPYVVNTSFDYNFQKVYHGENKILGAAANGWTVSNITSWQSGGNLQALNSPNFGLSLNYVNHPAALGSNNGIGSATYFGTDAAIDVMPIETCNPGSNLGGGTTIGTQKVFGQRVNGACFTAPPIGSNGPRNYQYLSGASLFDSDLALYKTFHINDRNSVQFRVSAFNWLNHPLPQFSGGNQLQLKETLDYNNPGAGYTVSPSQSPTYGYLDNKAGAPNQRIWELSLKYMF